MTMILEFRNQINRIAKILSLHDSYHSPYEFWDVSIKVGKGKTFHNSSWLFEFFINAFLPTYEIAALQKLTRLPNYFIEKYIHKFYFFVMFSCKLLGKQNLDYFFWFSFCLQYYGCSNAGIHFLSKFGVTLSERHFRRSYTSKLFSIKHSIHHKIPKHHVVVWLDNYSKLLKLQIPTSLKKNIPNYSATAFSFTPLLQIQKPHFGLLNYWLQNLQANPQNYLEFSFDRSYCYNLKKLTVPLRLDRRTFKSYVQVPDTILQSNCTSNVGLEECLIYINNKIIDTQFITLKCDINIYWRIIKYYFVPDKQSLVKSVIPFLGVWHIFKISVIKVYQAFCNTFLADCCFSINSSTKTVLSTPPLPHALSILLYIFPNIEYLKSEILILLESSDVKYHNHLKNLFLLLNNWIPTIIDFGISISSSNFDLFISRLSSILLILLECNCHTYTSAIFVFLSQLNFLYHRHNQYYVHIQNNFDAFIEEKNEILLSFLSRSVDSDPLKYDHNHLANNYCFLSVAKKVLSEFLHNDSNEKEYGKERVVYEHDVTSEESNLVLQQFSLIFQQIELDNWKFFKPQKIYRKSDVREFQTQNLFNLSTGQKLQTLIKKMDSKFSKFTNELI